MQPQKNILEIIVIAATFVVFCALIPSWYAKVTTPSVAPVFASAPPVQSATPQTTPTPTPMPMPTPTPPPVLVPYDGPVEHLFTHCLIAFPEITYSGNDMSALYDVDCITPSEFGKILASLYANNYILIDINLLLDPSQTNGAPYPQQPLMLPEGKKPLILSVDDVVYDARKMSRGMVDKLIVDNDGRVLSSTTMADGTVVVSNNNEVFPMVDAFCALHPDFSHEGAKGTLALTGFQGILGYRTQHDAPEGTDTEVEKQQALAVVAALKQNGWTFASHSYGHYYMNSKFSLENVQEDTALWTDEVKSLVGKTKIFVFPYGDTIQEDDPKFDVLYNDGFRLFAMVGSKQPYLKLSKDKRGLYQDRRSLDGYALRHFKDYYAPLFDTDAVFDHTRDVIS